MDTFLLILLTTVGYILAYRLYGKFLEKGIFKFSDDNKSLPSYKLCDGKDYVPTGKIVLFGHHYTSIAGTGPIVGPAIGVIWGWGPALLWVFFGSVFIGAFHDFGSLVLSLKNDGRSISDIIERYSNKRLKVLFFLIIFFELLVVIAIFGLVIAVIFKIFPVSVIPVWGASFVALFLGYLIYVKKRNVFRSTIFALLLLYGLVALGIFFPVEVESFFGLPSTGFWTVLLLVYAFIASVLPVTVLLQPRDYVNAWQLFVIMGMLFAGAVVSSFFFDMHIVAPFYNKSPAGAPPLIPTLFIVIACGAVSGFHSLVSSGTSSKQLGNPRDALFIGYGSMLFESFLATLVLVAVAAGIGLYYKLPDGTVLRGYESWAVHYSSWQASSGLSSKISAVVSGSANMLRNIGVPLKVGMALMGVFIASFAATTLDTATRIQRYIITEFSESVKFKAGANKFAATLFAVLSAALLAFATGADGTGALKLWPLFGAVNQLLAVLTLFLLFLYVLKKKRSPLYLLISFIPFLFMSIVTVWAVFENQYRFFKDRNILLLSVNAVVILLVIWFFAEVIIVINKNLKK